MKPYHIYCLVVVLQTNCFAQGTIQFINLRLPAGVNAPVYQSDGVTKLDGNQFMAELLVGPDPNTLSSLATIGFLTGNGSGYFDGGVKAVPSIGTGETAFVQVDVWNTSSGSTFTQAKASGLPNSWWASSVFTVTLGGGTINPVSPAALTGLGTSPVYLNSVPEPSTFVLAGLGLAVVLFRIGRRESNR